MILPASWAGAAGALPAGVPAPGHLHPVHRAGHRDGLAAGRRSVVGMLAGAGMAARSPSMPRAGSSPRRCGTSTRLGLIAARLIVTRLLEDRRAPIVVAIDDTLFKRWGRQVHHAFWTHDGAAQGGKKIARGNRWVIAGIVVRLPFVHRSGVPAGAVAAVGGQGHHHPGGVGRAAAGPARRRVPRPGRARSRGRRLPRQAAAGDGDDVDHPAAGQRRPVRHRAAAHRPPRAARR